MAVIQELVETLVALPEYMQSDDATQVTYTLYGDQALVIKCLPDLLL